MSCFLIETTGHTWDAVRHDWDLPRLNAWTKYCGDHPKLRDMVQAYLGIKPKASVESTEDLIGLLSTLPNVTQLQET